MTQLNNDSFNAGLQQAADSLEAFAAGPAQTAADAVGDAFARAGKRVAASLADAARSGELSVRGLVSALLRDLSKIALDRFVTHPIEAAFAKATGGLALAGARADGGPVNRGGAYLVGERGPELFVPTSSGQIQAGQSVPTITINIQMAPGQSLTEVKRSSHQVAAALARAVQRGSQLL